MNSIHNPFVNLAELINTIYPEEWGVWEKDFNNSRKDSRQNKIYLKGCVRVSQTESVKTAT